MTAASRSSPMPVSILGLGKGCEFSVWASVKLGEDQVPYLQVSVAVAPRCTVRLYRIPWKGPGQYEFRSRGRRGRYPPWPRNYLFRPTERFDPKGFRFLLPISCKLHHHPYRRRHEAVGGQFIALGQQFPCPCNGLFLEIVPKRKIPQHFKKGVVPGCVAHVFQIIVFSAGPHAFLGRGRPGIAPFLFPRKSLLNWTIPALVNSRVGSSLGMSEELSTISWP